MKKFDELKGMAAGNFGLVTASQAREIGIFREELSRWVKRGWLEVPGRGVYRISDYPPSPYDPFATAVESVGPDARIVGESVLGLLDLTSTNPSWIRVGTPGRIRRRLGLGLRVEKEDGPVEWYEGVRCQSVDAAIRSCIGKLPPERLREAVDNGVAKGYLIRTRGAELKREIGHGDSSEYGIS